MDFVWITKRGKKEKMKKTLSDCNLKVRNSVVYLAEVDKYLFFVKKKKKKKLKKKLKEMQVE